MSPSSTKKSRRLAMEGYSFKTFDQKRFRSFSVCADRMGALSSQFPSAATSKSFRARPSRAYFWIRFFWRRRCPTRRPTSSSGTRWTSASIPDPTKHPKPGRHFDFRLGCAVRSQGVPLCLLLQTNRVS